MRPGTPRSRPVGQTLTEIWRHYGERFRFRARDVETLEDFLVVNFWPANEGNLPTNMDCLKCEKVDFCYHILSCVSSVYAPLSSQEEVDYLNSIDPQRAKFLVKASYKKSLGQTMIQQPMSDWW